MKDLPKIPEDALHVALRKPLARVREELQRIMGTRGDDRDRAVRLGELIDAGIVSIARSNTGPGVRPGPGVGGGGGGEEPYVPDLTPPPTPTGLTVTAGISFLLIECDPEIYTQGRGHAETIVYGAQWPFNEPTPPTFANAVRITSASAAPIAYATNPNTRWCIWMKWKSRDGVESTSPAGGTNGVQATTGQDVTQLLEVLTGQITESQLFSGLGERIDLIDADEFTPGSVNYRIKQGDDYLAQQIVLLAGGGTEQFDSLRIWYFDATVDGWSGSNGGPSAVGGFLRPGAGSDPNVASPASLAVAATNYPQVKARIRRVGTPAWEGKLYWERTTDTGFDEARAVTVTEPTYDGNGIAVLTFNPAWDGTINRIRLDLSTSSDASNYFEIDWVAIGRPAPGASTAMVATETAARVAGDSANASAITTLQARMASRPNLLSNGGFEQGLQGWSGDIAGWYIEDSIWGRTAKRNATNGTNAIYSPQIPVAAGEWYTVSGDSLLFATGGSVYFDLIFYNASDQVVLDGPQNPRAASHDFAADDTNRAATAVEAQAPGGATYARARFVWSGVTGATVMGCRQIKVERGRLPYTPYSSEASLQQEASVRASADGALQAQYTVKVDVNGYVSGFGLASTANNATPFSEFAIRADRFYIASPSGPGLPPIVPFVVNTTTQTVNGVSVPPGVYMDAAFIKNGTIIGAKIADLTVDNAKLISVSAAKLTAGSIAVGQFIQSTGYVAGTSGWRINGNGSAEFSGVIVRGTIIATAGSIGGNTIDATGMQSSTYTANVAGWRLNSNGTGQIGGFVVGTDHIRSSNYSAGSAGWRLDRNGNFEANNGTFRGGGTFSGALQAATGTFAGSLSAATGTFSGSLTAAAVNAVNTINLAGQAVTIPLSAYTAGSANYGGATTWHTTVSLTVPGTGAPKLVLAGLVVSSFDNDATNNGPFASFRLLRNGSVVYEFSGFYPVNQLPTPVPLPQLIVTGGGTDTFELQVRADANTAGTNGRLNVRMRSIVAIEMKR
jgi:hypothetical protein